MSILWTILIGFIAGVIAKFVVPGDKHEPQGFILTTILGIVGAFVATYSGEDDKKSKHDPERRQPWSSCSRWFEVNLKAH
jgi:hypothetical protein